MGTTAQLTIRTPRAVGYAISSWVVHNIRPVL